MRTAHLLGTTIHAASCVEALSVSIISYRDLRVWRESVELAVQVYDVCNRLPTAERYGLASQIKRSAVSIPANIAEGCARHHTGEFTHHVSIAKGSLAELETLLILARELNFLPPSDTGPLLARTDQLSRMLTGLRQKLMQRARRPSKR